MLIKNDRKLGQEIRSSEIYAEGDLLQSPPTSLPARRRWVRERWRCGRCRGCFIPTPVHADQKLATLPSKVQLCRTRRRRLPKATTLQQFLRIRHRQVRPGTQRPHAAHAAVDVEVTGIGQAEEGRLTSDSIHEVPADREPLSTASLRGGVVDW